MEVEDGFNAIQASAKILEEEWKQLNENDITKRAYTILLSIECIKMGVLPDFLYDRLIEVFDRKIDIVEESNIFYVEQCKTLLDQDEYEIVETDFTTKTRIDYIYSLKQ
ncbi:hypothetical protein R2R35_06875 [Anaerocolumna sp. AGMB13020]|uniref:hypothetical protein n=1 Tax=Anaerocolumna sp. AGMB13020 TaxID=3081750 RepID=UPI0029554905|nr:hypothetical protein [Anaerocolumna sp. AGMB13020]WOO38219.1 hypothetical protein R2R35_06875 [Anaerocolumna sp. AGMB13020]